MYQAEEIRRFLEAIDRHLDAPVRLVVIGGGAALLAHGARSPTFDIDAYGGNPALLRGAVAAARAEVGFAVPINSAAVAELPLHFEDRQLRPLPQLRRLDVLVPDRYDLVLSKLIRASHKDFVVCKEIHEHAPLEPDVLARRYLDEMKYAVGRHEDHDHSFVAGVEFIWDANTADRVGRTIEHSRAQGVVRGGPRQPRGRGRGR